MRRLLPCAVLFLLVGCSDTSRLPTDQKSHVDRSAKPSMDGATVIPAQVVITFSDPSTSLAVLIGIGAGVTPTDVCNGTFTSAGTRPSFSRRLAGSSRAQEAATMSLWRSSSFRARRSQISASRRGKRWSPPALRALALPPFLLLVGWRPVPGLSGALSI